jgi:hypothetical protein
MNVSTILTKTSKFYALVQILFKLQTINIHFFRDNNLDLAEFEVFLNALFVSPKNTQYQISKQHVREILNCFDPEKVKPNYLVLS